MERISCAISVNIIGQTTLELIIANVVIETVFTWRLCPFATLRYFFFNETITKSRMSSHESIRLAVHRGSCHNSFTSVAAL